MAPALSPGGYVAALLRLKLRLSWNALGTSVWGALGTVMMLVLGLGGVLAVNVFLVGVAGRGSPGDVVTPAVLAGSGVTALWLIVPVFFSDRLMDPRRFVSFAVPRSVLVLGLTLAGMLNVGLILTLGWLLGHVLAWRSSAVAVVAAAATVPLALVMLGLLHQAASAAAGAWLVNRRSRDLLSILALCAMVGAYPITQGTLAAVTTVVDAADAVAHWLAWTP